MKVCPDCLCELFNVYGDDYVCINCDGEYKESELYDIPGEITEEMLKAGLDNGIIRITYNKRGTSGIACEIGGSLFYFDGIDGDLAESIEDYFAKYCPRENLPGRLHTCIGTIQDAEESGIHRDEWVYYAYTITKALKELSNMPVCEGLVQMLQHYEESTKWRKTYESMRNMPF